LITFKPQLCIHYPKSRWIRILTRTQPVLGSYPKAVDTYSPSPWQIPHKYQN